MDIKRKFSRQAEADPGAASSPAATPATAPPSSRSDSATPFSPSSSFPKCVTLHNWWLIKSDTDSGGRRLAVGGLNAHGKYVRVFTSAPIVKRHDAYTLETADGITVQIQGFINKNRTHNNGIPLEVSQCFSVGFPFNWEQYADGDFREMSTSLTQSMRCSGIEKQRDNLSDELPVCLDKLLDGLTSGIDASINDEWRKEFDFSRRNPSFLSSLSTALRSLSSSCSFRSSVASQPVETSRSHEMDKSNQNHENGVQCANLTGHEIVGNGLHDGVGGESSAVANDTVALLPTDMEEKLNDESERISVDGIVEGVSNDYVLRSQNHAERIRVHGIGESEVSAVRKDTNRKETDSLSVNTDMALQTAFRSSPNDEDRKLDDNRTTSSAEPAEERASNSSVSTERDDSNNKLGRGRYALRSQDHVRKSGVDNAGGSEGSVGRKYSIENYANSMIEKNLPFEPLIMAPNKKDKGYNLRSEVKNEWRSVKVKENFTTLGVFKQCEQIHVQSLVTDGPQEANLLSAEGANSKHHSMTPASPDVINKKVADHSEVRDDSDKLSEITGKRIEKLPNDQDGNQSEAATEAQLTKQKTHNESRQKMVRRRNYSKDGSVTGITDTVGLSTPSKGSRSEPLKKKKLRR